MLEKKDGSLKTSWVICASMKLSSRLSISGAGEDMVGDGIGKQEIQAGVKT